MQLRVHTCDANLLVQEPAVNRGRGCFFEGIWCLQAASWLSIASNLAASTALGEQMAHRRITHGHDLLQVPVLGGLHHRYVRVAA